MHFIRTIPKLSGKRDDLSNDKFCHTPRIAEWRVEDCNTVLCSIPQIHLIGANAEAAYDDKILGFFQHSSGELSLGTKANDVNISCYIFQPLKSFRGERRRTESSQSIGLPLERISKIRLDSPALPIYHVQSG